MRKLILPLLLILLTLAACAPASALQTAPEVGSLAPDFQLTNLAGEKVALSDYRGQPVLVNFWATWCPPCLMEMPVIEDSYKDGGFAVIAVDFGEGPDDVKAFAGSMGIDVPIVLDVDGSIQQLYRVRGFPTSFFIDADGVVQNIHIGGMNEAILGDYLAQLGVRP